MTTRVTVFRGPSLDRATAEEVLADHDYRPTICGPVAQGDVRRAVADGAQAIVLIDGVYESQPAVWHKEILAALADGIPVIGAASMGALRAAECRAFGMVGFGRVFEQAASGRLVADADVAVAHADAESDFRPLSVALVDIRATLAELARHGEVSVAEAQAAERAAARLYFPLRSWPRIVADAGLAPELASRLRAGHVRVKRADALGVLQHLPRLLDGWAPVSGWRLARSDAWQRVGGGIGEPLDPMLADLLRLEGRMPELMRAGLVRRLAAEFVPDVDDDAAIAELAEAVGDSQRWQRETGLAPRAAIRFARSQARLSRLWDRYGAGATDGIADQLLVEGSWQDYAEAVRQRRTVESAAPIHPTDQLAGGSVEAWAWYVAQTGTEADPADEACRLGFDDADHLFQALRREHAWHLQTAGDGRR